MEQELNEALDLLANSDFIAEGCCGGDCGGKKEKKDKDEKKDPKKKGKKEKTKEVEEALETLSKAGLIAEEVE
jgi:hypothetical protein